MWITSQELSADMAHYLDYVVEWRVAVDDSGTFWDGGRVNDREKWLIGGLVTAFDSLFRVVGFNPD